MKSAITFYAIAGSFALCTGLFASAQAADLTIYTYDSFVSEWGPGSQLEKLFEEQCACDIEFVGIEDGVSILNRLRIEKDKTKADVILGIDNALLEETRKTGLIAKHDLNLEHLLPELHWNDEQFVPFDFGYFAFIYDSSQIDQPVKSLKELVNSSASVIYQDPRTSTPGQGLMLWMKAVYDDEAASAWQQLAQHTVTVSKGWWEAYSMFLEGGSDYVLSYNTSPAYHVISENETKYKAALFTEGHVAQIEVAAMLNTTRKPELAKSFLAFLISPEAQAIIPVTNWMLPVAQNISLPDVFSELIQPEPIGFSSEDIAQSRQDWIKEWRSAATK